MYEDLKKLIPDLPDKCKKIVLTLEVDKPILLEVTLQVRAENGSDSYFEYPTTVYELTEIGEYEKT